MNLSNHPLNLALRFILEMIALVILGIWGWTLGSGFTSYLWTLVFPILAAVVWGTFRVPGDASASGKALVAVPGLIRIMLELALFLTATSALLQIEKANMAFVFLGMVGFHYLISWDRILWLLRS